MKNRTPLLRGDGQMEFLPLFNLGEPVTTGDSELVTGGMEQGSSLPVTEQWGKLVHGC